MSAVACGEAGLSFRRGKTVSVVERYSVVERRWERCASMETSRGSHGVGLLGGLVCAVAGGGINSNLASCEVCALLNHHFRYSLQ